MKNLNLNEFYNKVLGCYYGKTIGGTLGVPFETYRGLYDFHWFMQDISKPVPNDDVDLQLVWLRAIELEGPSLDSHTLAEYWNTYIAATLSEYGSGKRNFNAGILPPLSGAVHNELGNSNGAWIRSEIWACLCAGNPGLAANYAYYDSSVDHKEEGVYSAVFMAAVESAAFFESDIMTLIDIGLSYIPEDCGVAKAVRLVLKDYKEGKGYPEIRKDLLIKITSNFGEMCGYWKGSAEFPPSNDVPIQEEEPDVPLAPHGYDAPFSIGAVITGLLFGKKDIGRTVCIAADLGEDTDCTAGSVGALLGIIIGASDLDKKWKNAISNEIATCTLRIDTNLCVPKTIEELAHRICDQTPRVLGSAHVKLFKENDKGELEGHYEIIPCSDLHYVRHEFPWFPFYLQEDTKDLIAEQGRTLRYHFRGLTVHIKFDDHLVHIAPNESKTLELTFENRLFTPQFLSIRLLGLSPDMVSDLGNEFCVSLDHWHNNDNTNTMKLHIQVGPILTQGTNHFVMEIVSEGRSLKEYIPITFINGSCL